MRGETERIRYDSSDVLVLRKTWQDETIIIIINFSQEDRSVNIGQKLQPAALLTVKGEIGIRNEEVSMPGYSIAVML